MGGKRVGESGTKQEPGTERGGLSRPLTRWGATRISPASVVHARSQLTSRMMFSTDCPGPLHAHSHILINLAPFYTARIIQVHQRSSLLVNADDVRWIRIPSSGKPAHTLLKWPTPPAATTPSLPCRDQCSPSSNHLLRHHHSHRPTTDGTPFTPTTARQTIIIERRTP